MSMTAFQSRGWLLMTLITAALVLSVTAFADDSPQPDPSGCNTGAAANAFNAGGPAFTSDELKAIEESKMGHSEKLNAVRRLAAFWPEV